ncbi:MULTISPECIES: M23 family metallopeptidase [unclassified Rothia (in: high G+C Gram-positive bacteria)]|uniref:M23 family metallopeptidase n=1 Tax=unclassified Rothia (in: high G+C Gram-positive bacteria) TaxID=2689056 RepID=UPI000A723F99|nr:MULTISPECIES: M23 family metallopeptidase [unclassified Rothia (in: high G+C Gram-positive bacteria)]
MKSLENSLRHAALMMCCLLGALVCAGGDGLTGGAGFTGGTASAAKAPNTVELAASRVRYRSPTAASRPRVIRPFEKPAQRWSAGHRGVDLAVPEHDRRVYAPAPGKVVFSGTVVNRKVLVIAHPDGRRSTFEPMDEALPVGTTVAAGEVIGTVATASGGDSERPYRRCSTPCLYWGVRQGGARGDGSGKDAEYINPMSLLGSKEPSILLPVPGGY